MNERKTFLYLPGGEWLEALLVALNQAGIETNRSSDRCYLVEVLSMPLILAIIRSKEIPESISDPNSVAKAGLTGSDIALENRTGYEWEFPLLELNPNAPKPKIYLGITPNLSTKGFAPQLTSIQPGDTVYSPYLNIARSYLSRNGINAKVMVVAGKTEGRWITDPSNTAIVDITSTGKTMKANGITPIAEIMRPKVVLVTDPGIGASDRNRLNDLQEKVTVAAYKRRKI